MRDARKSRLVPFRSGLAVSADAQHDKSRINLAQRLEPDAPLLERPRAEVLQHDIGLGNELPEDLGTVGRAQIERDGFLVASFAKPYQTVATLRDRPKLPERVPRFGLLDLDHLGTEIGE